MKMTRKARARGRGFNLGRLVSKIKEYLNKYINIKD